MRVVASGVLPRPYDGPGNSGSVSGFVIDPSGLAVTVSHAVSGASSLKVMVGDPGRELPATLLHADECSDLAVIQIDADGEALPAVRLAATGPAVGSSVTALGFERLTTDPVVARGELMQTAGPGDLQFASVPSTLRFTSQPLTDVGMAGGPLVADDGSVVGVLFPPPVATDDEPVSESTVLDESTLGMALGIDLAGPMIEALKNAPGPTSLGLNATAVNEDGVVGVWVAGVDPYGPAAAEGVRAGDLITQLGGAVAGERGTLATYCSTLARHQAGAPMSMTLTRADGTEQLYGSVFSGEGMEHSAVFAVALGGPDALGQAVDPPPAPYTTFDPVVAGPMSTTVPTAWTARVVDPQVFGDTAMPTLIATTDLGAFRTTPTVPGVGISVHPYEADPDAVLARLSAAESCSTGPVGDYLSPMFEGRYAVWIDCNGTPADMIVLVLNPRSGTGHTVWVVAHLVGRDDLGALDQALRTLMVTP